MQDVMTCIQEEKLVLIARGIPMERLLQAAEACANAGVRLLECTFNHMSDDPIAENTALLKRLAAKFGGRLCLGAGTVLTVEEVHAACDAGARYIISPDGDERVIAETKRLGMVSIPGAMTPTEIKRARNMGADIVKLFPADDLGYHFIQNLQGPLGHIPLMATGGVNPATIPEFLKLGVQAVGTGITVFRRDLMEQENYEGIGVLAKMHVDAVRLAMVKE